MAHLHRRPGAPGRAPRRALSRYGDRTIRRTLRRRAGIRSQAFHRAHARRAAGTCGDEAARTISRRLPHRVRFGWQRPQGRRRDRRPRRLQQRDGVGPLPQARSPVSLRWHHGLAEAGRRAPAPHRCHRRQRRRRLREQPREGRVAVSRRAQGHLRGAGLQHVPRHSQGRGTTCRSRS